MEQKITQVGQRVRYVAVNMLSVHPNNPRSIEDEQFDKLCESIKANPDYFETRPILANPGGVIFAGNQRYLAAKKIGLSEVPVVIMDISPERQREIMLRDNRQSGEWNLKILATDFEESILTEVGFSSTELDDIFVPDETHEPFDLERELEKLKIDKVVAQKGDLYELGNHRLLVGDSTSEADILRLMNGEKADMCLTDPPYRLDYLQAKRHGKPTEGFGYKKDRKYLETDELPADFTERWVANVAQVAKPDFSIIVYESWKNLREVWAELERYWKVKNMIVWHLPNRHQGFSAKYKFFSKHDIAMVAASGEVPYNHKQEPDGLQEEYETALYAISGKPQWEGYDTGKKYQPTDFIEFNASDEKHSGQGVVFGTKPVEILLPYMKVLTKRGDLVIEPFGGSGSTLICAEKLKRRCYLVEKSPVYAEVIMKRWEKLTGQKRKKVNEEAVS